MKTLPIFIRQGRRRCRSQSLVEFTLILPIFLTLMCAVFDYGYMITNAQILAMAAREGASTATRQVILPIEAGLQAVTNAAHPRLNLAGPTGACIITKVVYDPSTSTNYVYVPTPVDSYCLYLGGLWGGTANDVCNKSRILSADGTDPQPWKCRRRQLPFAGSWLATNQEMYVVEVFLTNQFVTPIGRLIGLVTPPILYDAAFF